jgi:uncharacterized protein involved in high-affinity Fe2+ transport
VRKGAAFVLGRANFDDRTHFGINHSMEMPISAYKKQEYFVGPKFYTVQK